MKKINSSKILNICIGILISFLAIFIVSMLARSLATNVLPEDSRVSLFINDYVDMMTKKIDNLALRMKIKRNTVSQYQVDLINQSIDDYVNYSMFKSANAVSSYNPNSVLTSAHLEKYKNEYYKMTLENPYVKSMTLFNTDGEMSLNLYASENKSWPLELDKKLIDNLKIEGSLVLNASNENSFYIMQYIKNRDGEFIVTTRNDYAYVSDIAMYYQVADKSLYVNDSKNIVYNIPEGMASISMDPVSSVIGQYAYYKQQPSFIDNNTGLSITLFGREYPNYFELIVLAITAFFIVVLQYLIRGGIYFFAQLTGLKKVNEDHISLPKNDIPMIDDDIVNQGLPQSIKYEDVDLSDQKVVHKVDENLIYPKENQSIDKDLLYSREAYKSDNINLGVIPSFSLDEKLKVNKNPLSDEDDFDDEISSDKVETISEYEDTESVQEELVYSDDIDTDDIIEEVTTDDVVIEKFPTIEDFSIEKSATIEKVATEENETIPFSDKIEETGVFNLEKPNEVSVNSDIKPASDKVNSSNNEDVFLAFDNMLASIIDKVESDAKDSVNKKV